MSLFLKNFVNWKSYSLPLVCNHISWAAQIILTLLIAYGNLFPIPFKIQFSKYNYGTLSSTVALLLTQWAYLEKVRDAEQIFRTGICCLSGISSRVVFLPLMWNVWWRCYYPANVVSTLILLVFFPIHLVCMFLYKAVTLFSFVICII